MTQPKISAEALLQALYEKFGQTPIFDGLVDRAVELAAAQPAAGNDAARDVLRRFTQLRLGPNGYCSSNLVELMMDAKAALAQSAGGQEKP